MTAVPPRIMIEARRALLDALDALAEHRQSLVLVGAQAVYLRTSEVELPFSASFTTDADFAVDPSTLADKPSIGEAMRHAGFALILPDRPGIWGRRAIVGGIDEMIPVDLLVPEAVAGPGRRAARLPGHAKHVAGRAVGLEAALFDRSPMQISSLDPADVRTGHVDVAGATALLVAKLHKIGERAAAADIRPDRLLVKDGADVYRLMLHLDPVTTVKRLTSLLAEPVAVTAIIKAVDYLRSLFRTPMSVGTRLAVAGLDGVVARDRVETVCITFTGGVLTDLD
jgi:hypothetical protein